MEIVEQKKKIKKRNKESANEERFELTCCIVFDYEITFLVSIFVYYCFDEFELNSFSGILG